jgi:hypothetical protein
VLARHSSSVKILQLYVKFLQGVKGDPWTAGKKACFSSPTSMPPPCVILALAKPAVGCINNCLLALHCSSLGC